MMKIAPDKWKHFYAGIILGAFLQAVFMFLFDAGILASLLIVFLIVVAISYGFELFSKVTGMGHYDVMDAIASIIGGILGMGLVVLISSYV